MSAGAAFGIIEDDLVAGDFLEDAVLRISDFA